MPSVKIEKGTIEEIIVRAIILDLNFQLGLSPKRLI